MKDAGPWLVLGGAAVVIACVVVVLLVVLRQLSRARRDQHEAETARTALERALAAGPADADAIVPLLLAAAIEAGSADAAALTIVSAGGRRRSYCANVEATAARRIIQELLADTPSARRDRVVLPIRAPGRTGLLGVYWWDGAPAEVDGVSAELERLATTALPAGAEPADRAQPAAAPASERWSRVAQLNATLELEPLLRRIAESALADSAADAVAASVRDPSADEPVAETVQLAEHERDWVAPILRAETVVPSITRYVGPQPPAAGGDDAPIATTIVVPLRDADGEPLGNLVAVWRRDLGDEVDARLADLEALAEHARVAIDNAIRFRRLQAVAVRDPVSGIFDQRYFVGALADACEVAQQRSEPLLVIALSAVDVAAPAGDVDLTALEGSLVAGAAHIAAAVGDRGVTCRVSLNTFAVIVPGTAPEPGLGLRETLEQLLGGDASLRWQVGAVERKRYEEAGPLWERALGELGPVAATSDPPAPRSATAW